MQHIINFIWMSAIAVYSSYCLIKVCAIIYKAHTGQISAKDVKEKCLTCFIAAVAFLVFVSILYKSLIIKLF